MNKNQKPYMKIRIRLHKYSIITAVLYLTLFPYTSFAGGGGGDDPCTATVLTVGTTCSPVSATNTGATNSSVPDVACDGGSSDGDIWFSAVIGASGSITISTNPGTLTDVGMAIYGGANCSSLSFISCTAGGNPSHPAMPVKTLTGLTSGNTIWIRLWDVDNDETGSFDICAVVCSASVTVTGPTSGCSGDNNQLCATAGFSSYTWSTGETTQCINVNSSNTYTVTVTDANGCSATDSENFTALPSPSVSITGPAAGCSDDNIQLCAANGFSHYEWSNGDTTSCISPAMSGNYTVEVTAANGCTASDAHAVTIYTSPSVAITGPPSKCANGNDQLCVPNTFSGYSWSSGAVSSCINPNTSGTYTVTVTDAHGCTATNSHAIAVHSNPAPIVTGPSSACPGTGAQLCATGGFSSYSWSNGSTTSCVNPSTSGTYTVTVTDGFGCTGTDDASITIHPAASVSISGPSSVCIGLTGQLCVPSGYANYNWSNGGTSTCITTNTPGTYTVIVTDGNGCTATDSRAFSIDSLPSSAITGPATSCNGASVQLCAPAGHASYLWSNSSNSSCITTSTSGTYTVTVTGVNGCTSSSSHALTVYPLFAITISGPSTACSGTNTQLCATSGPYTYQWSNGATTSCINPTVSGTYSVVATNTNGCSRTASKGLTVYSPLNASITGPTSACTGSVVPLCASPGATSYAWSTGATTDCINVNSNGTYSVIISDVHNCTASSSVTVSFSSTFNVDITGPATGCMGSLATICVPSGYASYAWNTGDTTECIDVSTPGNYSVTVHDPIGCVANSFYNLTFSPLPTISITGPATICKGGIANWCATSGYPDYLWSNGGTGECINVSDAQLYTITVVDSNGCSNTSGATLEVIDMSPDIIESNNLLICDTFNSNFTYSWLINGNPANCFSDTCTPTFSALYTVIVTDTVSDCSESATYTYVNTTGVFNHDEDYSVVLYPNPFSGNRFFVATNRIEKEITVEVFDMTGKLSYKNRYNPKATNSLFEIELPEPAAGLYYVYIRMNDKFLVRKIVCSN